MKTPAAAVKAVQAPSSGSSARRVSLNVPRPTLLALLVLVAVCLGAALLILDRRPVYDAGVTSVTDGRATNKVGFYVVEYGLDGSPYR